MLFTSVEFLLFLPTVFVIYWFILGKSLKYQNYFLVAASYFFYGWWDWRFLGLLIFTTLVDYLVGIQIYNAVPKLTKKRWLIFSVLLNLIFLGFFKYFNFFIDSTASLLTAIGFDPHMSVLKIVLPVGISFYTFHGLSYVFDIYNNKIQPTRNWANYTLFVSFFPLLVAGPIERATNLIPQIEKPRTFDYFKAVDGLRQMLWGLVKKIVIADNCAVYVDAIFENYTTLPASTLVVGVIYFSFQIYGDFSGYSDIAIGCGRLFGFSLQRNFAFPYFSRDIAEFWRRWHISLTSWLRDYLYIPLGGSQSTTSIMVRNTFIIFLVSGFWHGANWTFIFWGLLNAIYFLPLQLKGTSRDHLNTVAEHTFFPSGKEILQMITTFCLISFSWIFFRSNSINDAIGYITHLFNRSILEKPLNVDLGKMTVLISFFVIVEWIQRKKLHGLEFINQSPALVVRWSIYTALISLIFWFGRPATQFIYFQF
ncbi:MAG: MBOAT family O-acyltransferase [Cyclobacteriaceae bacterium]|jgi:alginate O-acetyltransferase complex protein AlgI